MPRPTTRVPKGSIVWCDRVKHIIEESVEEIEAALRYPSNGSSAAELGQIVWRMTDGPPGFIKVTPQDDAGFVLALAVSKISSYQIRWVPADGPVE